MSTPPPPGSSPTGGTGAPRDQPVAASGGDVPRGQRRGRVLRVAVQSAGSPAAAAAVEALRRHQSVVLVPSAEEADAVWVPRASALAPAGPAAGGAGAAPATYPFAFVSHRTPHPAAAAGGAVILRDQAIVLPRLRHLAPAAAARQQLADGAIGTLAALRLNWQCRAGTPDVLDHLGAEALDYVLWCVGPGVAVERLHAVAGRLLTERDMVTLTLRFAGGVIATVELEAVLPAGFPRDDEVQIELLGEAGVIRVAPNRQQVTLFDGADRAPTWDGWVDPPEVAMVEAVVRTLLDGAPPAGGHPAPAAPAEIDAALDLVRRTVRAIRAGGAAG